MKHGKFKDCTKKELVEFVERLNSSQFKEIEDFFETMPKLSHDIEVENPNTKSEINSGIGGTGKFFGLSILTCRESYYELTFSLIQYHKYKQLRLKNMMWERDVYVNLLRNYLERNSNNNSNKD